MSSKLRGVPVSFKTFAKKTVPLGYRPQTKAKPKLGFSMTTDLAVGDRIYYTSSRGERVPGVFAHYSSDHAHPCMVWADWSHDNFLSRGWMPVDQVYLDEMVGDTGIEPVT